MLPIESIVFPSLSRRLVHPIRNEDGADEEAKDDPPLLESISTMM
jgi:hypothetical protein